MRAISVDGQAIGSIGLFPKHGIYRKSAEIGYWIGEPFWNKGIVTNAVKNVCNYCFSESDIIRIYAEIFSCNKASARVLQKCDFELEGWFQRSLFKNNKLFDSCIYSLLKN